MELNEAERLGDKAFEEENYKEAIKYYRVAILKQPTKAELWNNKAKCYLKLGYPLYAFFDARRANLIHNTFIKCALLCMGWKGLGESWKLQTLLQLLEVQVTENFPKIRNFEHLRL